MQMSLLRYILLCTISIYHLSVSHGQNIDSQDLSKLLQAPDNLTQSEHYYNLLYAEKNYFDQGAYANYLEVKYSIFEILAKDKKIESAFKHAHFATLSLDTLQRNASEPLAAYYDKILRYSVMNQHFEPMKQLALDSYGALEVNTRSDSIYLFNHYRWLGLIHRYLGEYDRSFEHLKKSLNLGTEVYGKGDPLTAVANYNIGINYAITGDFNNALSYLLLSKEIKLKHYTEDSLSLSHDFNALGLVYEGLGDYDEAMLYHEKTIKLKRRHSDKFNRGLGRSYLNLGTLLITMGQPQLAYQKSKFALNKLSDIGEGDIEMAIWFRNNIGRSLVAMDRSEEAIKYLTGGLLLNKNKFDLSIEASLEESLGMAYLKMQEYDKAIKYLSRSQEKFIKDAPDHQRVAQLDIGLSQCYYHTNQMPLAEKYATDALDRLQKKLAIDHPMLFHSYYQLGKIYHQWEDDNKSISFIDKIDSLTNISSLNQLKTLNLKLEIYEGIDLEAFHIHKGEGLEHIDKTLKEYIPTEERYLLSKEIKRFYNLSLRNWESSKDPADIEELLEIFNNSKNSILKANVLSNQVNSYTDVPSSITSREYTLAKKIRYLESISIYSYEALDEKASKHNLEQLEYLQHEYKVLLDSIEKHYPRYFDLKFSNKNTEVSPLLEELNDNTALLDFFKGEDFIWILTVHQGEVQLIKKSLGEIWEQTLLKFKNALSNYNAILDETMFMSVYDQFAQPSYTIYNYLLRETLDQLPSNVTSLVIIPDGILNFIPFETLLQSDVNIENSDYRQLDYLINTYNISYSYSMSLVRNQNRKSHQTKDNYSGFAPSYQLVVRDTIDLEIPLSDLPAARKSVEKASKLFNGRSYISEHATKNNFINSARESSILHLAMHCIVDNNSPMDTKLIFSSDTTEKRKYITAADLYNIQLDNQLSVLTACNTGVGNIRDGEGVISLSRAFTYAGSKSLMMSLWSIPDAQTAHIIETFFNGVKSGRRKDESLKNAKIRYLSEAPKSASHPMFWAGFIISGNTEPVRLTAQLNPIYFLIPLIGFIFFLFYRNRQRKQYHS